MKKTLTTILISLTTALNAQMLITPAGNAATNGHTPHPSAMLELRSSNQGFLVPRAALTGAQDTTTVPSPVEGTAVVCTTTNADHEDLPNTIPTLAVWNGERWLFSYLRENVVLDLDKVRNFIFQNTNSVIFSEGGVTSNFPNTNPSFSFGQNTTGWSILIDSDAPGAGALNPSFEFDYDDATQRLVIDVEGISAVNNNTDNIRYGYAVGIFVEDRLVNAQKFYHTNVGGACTFHKYNLRAILEENQVVGNPPTPILNKLAGETYNVKVGVRALTKGEAGEGNFSRLVFGGDAGDRYGTTTPCANLNPGTARSYMNVLTIEQHDVQDP